MKCLKELILATIVGVVTLLPHNAQGCEKINWVRYVPLADVDAYFGGMGKITPRDITNTQRDLVSEKDNREFSETELEKYFRDQKEWFELSGRPKENYNPIIPLLRLRFW